MNWLDDLEPHEPDRARAQLEGLLALLGRDPVRVLDLGCGAGRTIVPVAAAGHDVTGIDHSADALRRCSAALDVAGGRATLVEADFTVADYGDGSYDFVCCLGNTFMTLHDVDVAVDVLRRAAAALRPDGRLVLDDCADDLWPELTAGNWQAGLSEDGSAQLVWAPDDAVFALRDADHVDTSNWAPGPSDTPHRLWTAGALRLAARCAGLSVPVRLSGAGLLTLATADPHARLA